MTSIQSIILDGSKSFQDEKSSEQFHSEKVAQTELQFYYEQIKQYQEISKDLEKRLEKLDAEFTKYKLKCEIDNKDKELEIDMLKTKNNSLSSDYKQLTEAYMRLEKQYHQRAKHDMQIAAIDDGYKDVNEIKKTRNVLKQDAINSLTVFFGYL